MSDVKTRTVEAVPTLSATERQVIELEQVYLMPTYARYPLVIERGRGCWVYDVNGKRYLDFLGGLAVNALGHAHPRIVKVIRDQAAKAIHISNLYYHRYQGLLAERLARMSGLERVFFSNTGAEAIEGALKLARVHAASHGGKTQVLALENSFHGRTMGALAVTSEKKYRQPFEPLISGCDFIRFNDLDDLRAKVSDATAAILLEPIQGEGGIFEASEEFLVTAEEMARRHNALLIVDEIQCGLGRTGAYFAFKHYGIRPDVVVVAKPIAAGLPLGAIIANDRTASLLSPGMHGTTFGGGPLACRVALEFLDILEQENLLEHVNKVGGVFRERLALMQTRFPFVKSVRGRGLMLALDLDFPARQVVLDALAAGLLINSTHDTVVRFLPPFIITEEQVDKGLKILERVLSSTRYPIREAAV